MQSPDADFTSARNAADLDIAIDRIGRLIGDGTLPVSSSTIGLREGEVAHLRINASWSEMVRESDHRGTVERLTHFADGVLQVTNQRLVFVGPTKTAAIEFGDILEIGIVDGDLHMELIGPHDPYFSIQPIAALQLTELILRTTIGRAVLTRGARLIGSTTKAHRRRKGL